MKKITRYDIGSVLLIGALGGWFGVLARWGVDGAVIVLALIGAGHLLNLILRSRPPTLDSSVHSGIGSPLADHRGESNTAEYR